MNNTKLDVDLSELTITKFDLGLNDYYFKLLIIRL